jgi:hypothetical protein
MLSTTTVNLCSISCSTISDDAVTLLSSLSTLPCPDMLQVAFTITFGFLPDSSSFALLFFFELFGGISLDNQSENLTPLKPQRTFCCLTSSFFASSSSFGTPLGSCCALRHSFHSSKQKAAVGGPSESRILVCISLISCSA